jgi:hypothetical protein
MHMVQKQPDAYKQERETRRRAYMSAPSLKEQFPEVEQLVLQLTFADSRGSSRHSPQTHIFGPAARGYFEVPCPFSSCTSGGYNLSLVISDMLSRRRRSVSGRLICHGWQDRGRVGEHRCLLELRYQVSASYETLVDASAHTRLERPEKSVAPR